MSDVHSFAQPETARVLSVALDLVVSFEQRSLSGSATLGIEASGGPLTLDTRDLSVERVEASADGANFAEVRWELGARDPILGAPLTIEIAPAAKLVRVHYRTSPEASGLQWLEPAQTGGKKHPFLFSQSQSIHARSWIPLQDSPGVRVTFTARIRVPGELTAVMSAEQRGAAGGIFEFAMETPIPAYLIALAVGDLQFEAIGPRTGIFAEPSMLARAVYEFADMEKMVAAVEALYGPYRWGRYDLLILPPSFPFGGMENPRLTFVTPTVIAGDRSLTGLISHELAHSWSGNLVTNATWRDFWLNEGFTTYIEGRIQEAVYGREQSLMEQVLARRTLERELAEFAPGDQILYIDLTGRDPDDGTTSVPYHKGALLLRAIEQQVGRARFDEFLKRYFDRFAFQSITTETALAFLRQELNIGEIPLDEWVHQPGLPAGAHRAVSERLEISSAEAKTFAEGKAPSTAGWSTQEWLEFLQALPPLDAARLAELDRAFHLTDTGNAEILDQWLKMAIEAGYEPAYPRLEAFLMEVGRMKFLRPLYTALMKTPEGTARAQDIYKRARPGYHPIAQTSIDKIAGKPTS